MRQENKKTKNKQSHQEISTIRKFLERFLGFFFLSIFLSFPCSAANAIPTLSTAIPFLGVLLSIAFCPLLTPSLWHKHDNLILISWTFLSMWLCYITIGGFSTGHLVSSVLIKEYIPFIILIGTLYIISGGISIHIHREGTTYINVFIFIIGEIFSNFIGTTGTSMLLLRPMLEVNKHRKHQVHTVIFFIFLVSNIGGCLLPFGDPPLFLGYLKGVNFFWTAQHMFPLFLSISTILLLCYIVIDKWFLIKEPHEFLNRNEDFKKDPQKASSSLFSITGYFNIILMLLVVILVAFTGILPKKEAFSIFNTSVHYKGFIRDIGLVGISCISFLCSPRINGKNLHKLNKFSWEPLSEVARYFIAIFITMAPVAIMLKSGHEFFQPIRSMLENTDHAPFWYFWFVSPFSAFLDNAPTYLVFFKMAGGNAQFLMGEGARILTAISAGSVFMGAITYIGNAPNFMVRSIAKQYGISMPTFLGYMTWSCAILLPILIIISCIMLY